MSVWSWDKGAVCTRGFLYIESYDEESSSWVDPFGEVVVDRTAAHEPDLSHPATQGWAASTDKSPQSDWMSDELAFYESHVRQELGLVDPASLGIPEDGDDLLRQKLRQRYEDLEGKIAFHGRPEGDSWRQFRHLILLLASDRCQPLIDFLDSITCVKRPLFVYDIVASLCPPDEGVADGLRRSVVRVLTDAVECLDDQFDEFTYDFVFELLDEWTGKTSEADHE